MKRLLFSLFALAVVGLPAATSLAVQNDTYDEALVIAIQNTIIASEAPGIVNSIEVEPGDDVAVAQVLASLNREKYRAELEVAVAEEKIAVLQAENRVDLEFAQKSAEVNQKLLDRGQQAQAAYPKSITLTDLDRLQLELEQSLLSAKQAEMELAAAKLTAELRGRMRHVAEINLQQRNVSAPFGGRVAQIYVQPGQWINAGEPMVRLTDLSRLRIQAYFGKDVYHQIRKGSRATYEFSVGGEIVQVPVEISFVGSEFIDGIFQVWADVDNSNGKLLPGLKGRLVVDMDSHESGRK